VTQNLCYAAFLHPKVGKKSKGCERAQNMVGYYPKNHIHPFLDYIVNSFFKLEYFGVWVGGVGCGCNTSA